MKAPAQTSLDALFAPRVIAVIGASDAPDKIGGIIYRNLLRTYAKVYPVHPSIQEIEGRPVYTSVKEVPETIDLAVIATPVHVAVQVARACAEKRVRVMIPVAAGFREVGPEGAALEQELVAAARAGGVRVLGPNTLGVFVPGRQLDTIFVEHGDRSLLPGGPVAFITQSGSVGVEALGLASFSGFGLRAFVGLGNKADIDEIELARYFGDDPETGCLAFYLETFSDGRTFLSVCREIAATKPVVILKAGRSPTGASAVASHTGALTGSDRVVDGAFRQHGILRALDDEALVDSAKVLSQCPPARGHRVAVLGPAGGYGVMAADYIEAIDRPFPLTLARLSSETQQHIQSVVPSYASVHNPIDLTASVTNDMYVEVLQTLCEAREVDVVLAIVFLAPPGVDEELIPRMAEIIRSAPKPVVIFSMYGPWTERYLHEFYRLGVAAFPSIYRAARAIRVLVERGILLRRMEE